MPTLAEAMNSVDKGLVLKSGKFATRKAFGMALRMLARNDKRVQALDADTRNSTFTQDFLAEPEATDRFAECKIAEQNMVSVAAGLAAAEKVPFCASFSKFLTRALTKSRWPSFPEPTSKLLAPTRASRWRPTDQVKCHFQIWRGSEASPPPKPKTENLSAGCFSLPTRTPRTV